MIARSSILVVLAAVASLAGSACSKKGEAATCATCVTASEKGFTPSSLTLPKGGAGSKQTVTFTRTSDDTCARDVVIPELSVNKPLPLNTPVGVDIPTDTERTLTFQCGMKMYKSSITIK